jgi:hypothetical protein
VRFGRQWLGASARQTSDGRGLALAATALALSLAACGTFDPSFPATSTCPNEVQAAGTFPDLEALLPRGMIERSPDEVDSGRHCTAESLGTYAAHGVRELRFAGATWDHGEGDATVTAVFATSPGEPPLQPGWVEEFYQLGALSGRRIENVETSRPTIGAAGPVWRLDALVGLSLQTIVVWPAGQVVRVVIVATEVGPDASRADHDQRVAIAVDVAHAVPVPPAPPAPPTPGLPASPGAS